MVKIVLALLVFIVVPKCHAVTSGTETMMNCAIAVRSMDGDRTISNEDAGLGLKCIGMVEGVMDTLIQWEESSRRHRAPLMDTACLPAGVTVGQAVQVSYKYMKAHPEQLHVPGSGLIYLALTEAFPCKT